jgi:hypothetical protein
VDGSHVAAMMMMVITLLDLFRELRRHGVAFEFAPDGKKVNVLFIAALPSNLDALLIENQTEMVDIARAVDLKQPIAWDRSAALGEVREAFLRIGNRFLELPAPMRQHADRTVRPTVDKATNSIAQAFERRDMPTLRLALLEAEGEIVTAIAGAERAHGN